MCALGSIPLISEHLIVLMLKHVTDEVDDFDYFVFLIFVNL